jgi:hypothetical protein
MVPIIDVACVLVGRLDIKEVVDTRRLREARVHRRSPFPAHGDAGFRGVVVAHVAVGLKMITRLGTGAVNLLDVG